MEPSAIYALFEQVLSEGLTLDRWQQQILDYEGNVTIRAGRQVGKSEIISLRRVKLALKYPGSKSLIIAPSQRQSAHLFRKVKEQLTKVHLKMLEAAGGYKKNPKHSIKQQMQDLRDFEAEFGIFKDVPTNTMLILSNGSEIYCLPAGKTGDYLRCFTLDFIDVDEAAYVPDQVWKAIKPMLAVAKSKGLGWISLLSTPFGKGGFFADSFTDDDYRQFHISSEDCRRIPRDFLKKERERLSKVEYAQEYLGEFVDEFNQLFPTELIKKRMTFIEWDKKIYPDRMYFLGVDVARYGGDENGFIIAELRRDSVNKQVVRIVYVEVTSRKSIMDTVARIINLYDLYKFNKIFVDSSGVGGGLYDVLVEKLPKRIIIGLENARRTVDNEGRMGKLFKEDLYSNSIVMMEREPPMIEIISDLKLLRSLKSMTFEYTADRNLRITGMYSHLAEAFVRACWCIKEHRLNLYVY